jgi:transcriptional repressor NrdR
MVCPNCRKTGSKVIDKRNNQDTNVVRRRRECLHCQTRYTTYEKIESCAFLVRKKSGKVEDFDRTKLKNSILKGLKKRNIPETEIEQAVDQIEIALNNKHKSVIDSQEIGIEVLKRLKDLDKVAYMLYATVYLDFASITEISQELNKLI